MFENKITKEKQSCSGCKYVVFNGSLGIVAHTQFQCEETGEDITRNIEDETTHANCTLEIDNLVSFPCPIFKVEGLSCAFAMKGLKCKAEACTVRLPL